MSILSIMTHSIMTLSITTLNIIGLIETISIVKLSIMTTISIRVVLMSAAFLFLC